MGDHGTPRRAGPQLTIGATVTFVTDPALLGREGVIVAINPQNDFLYSEFTVELAGGDIVTCRAEDLARVP